MKSKDILDAMNNIDKKFINEAYPSKGEITMEKNNLSNLSKSKKIAIPIAACLAFAAVGTIIISTQAGKKENNLLSDLSGNAGEVTTVVTEVTAVTNLSAEEIETMQYTAATLLANIEQSMTLRDSFQTEIDEILAGVESEEDLTEEELAHLSDLRLKIENLNADIEAYQVEYQEIDVRLQAYYAAQEPVVTRMPLSDNETAELEARLEQCQGQLVAVQKELDQNNEQIKALTAGFNNVDELDEAQKAELEELQAWGRSLKTEYDKTYEEIENIQKRLADAPIETTVTIDATKCIPTVLPTYQDGDDTITVNKVDNLSDLIFFEFTGEIEDGRKISPIDFNQSDYNVDLWLTFDSSTEDGKTEINRYYDQDIFPKNLPSKYEPLDTVFNIYTRTPETTEKLPEDRTFYDNNHLIYSNNDSENDLVVVSVEKDWGPLVENKGEFVNFTPSTINGNTCVIYTHEYAPDEQGTIGYYAYFTKVVDGTLCTYHIIATSTTQDDFMEIVKGYLS